jgi:hypothetical protein
MNKQKKGGSNENNKKEGQINKRGRGYLDFCG